MLWGVESHVRDRFVAAGVPAENIFFSKETFSFELPYPPAEFLGRFRKYYGPTMNAYEAAEKNGKAGELQRDLEALFGRENRSGSGDRTSIPASYLKVTVNVP